MAVVLDDGPLRVGLRGVLALKTVGTRSLGIRAFQRAGVGWEWSKAGKHWGRQGGVF